MLIGAHVSVKGGLSKAFDHVARFGAEAFQIFTKSNVQWAAKPLEADDVYAWLSAWESSEWPPCFVHYCYLINLASGSEEFRQKSVAAMVDELERASLLAIPWVVAHPGSFKESTLEQSLESCVRSVREILAQTEDSGVGILLENTAGMGSSIGSQFEHLGHVIKAVHTPERLGVCLDTCHAFAAGHDFRTAATYEAFWRHFAHTIGLSNLQAFHLNDCKSELGSRIDRHAPTGKGSIGLEAFRLLVNDPRFEGHPGVLEVKEEFIPESLAVLDSLRQ